MKRPSSAALQSDFAPKLDADANVDDSERAAALRRADRTLAERVEKTRAEIKRVELFSAFCATATIALGLFLLGVLFDHWILPNGFSTSGRLAFASIWLVATAAFFVARLVPALRREINPLFAAKVLEDGWQDKHNLTINWLQLRRRPVQTSRERAKSSDFNDLNDVSTENRVGDDALRAAMLEGVAFQAAKRAESEPVEAFVDCAPLIRWGVAFAVVVALCAGYAVFSPKNPFASAGRIVAPFAKIDRPQAIRFKSVSPGDAVVYRGDFLEVDADIPGAGSFDVALSYSTEDGRLTDVRVPAESLGGSRYRAKFPDSDAGFEENSTYRLVVGEGTRFESRSEVYRVEVRPSPSIRVEKTILTFPEYTGIAPQTFENQGDVRALEGTAVEVVARAGSPLKNAFLLPDGVETRALSGKISPNDPTVATFSFQLAPVDAGTGASNGGAPNAFGDVAPFSSYRLTSEDADGARNRDARDYSVETFADVPPTIRWESAPEGAPEVPLNDALRLKISAEDPDFSLRAVRLNATIRDLNEGGGAASTRPNPAPIDLPLGSDAARAKAAKNPDGPTPFAGPTTLSASLVPEELGLQVGDEIEYWAEAVDSKRPNANVASTEKLLFVVGEPIANPSKNTPNDAADESENSNETNASNKTGGDGSGSGGSNVDESSPENESGENAQAGEEGQNGENGESNSDDADPNGESGSQSGDDRADPNAKPNDSKNDSRDGNRNKNKNGRNGGSENASDSGSDKQDGESGQDGQNGENAQNDVGESGGGSEESGEDGGENGGAASSNGNNDSDAEKSDGGAGSTSENADESNDADESPTSEGDQTDGAPTKPNAESTGGKRSNGPVDGEPTDAPTPIDPDANPGDAFEKILDYMKRDQANAGSNATPGDKSANGAGNGEGNGGASSESGENGSKPDERTNAARNESESDERSGENDEPNALPPSNDETDDARPSEGKRKPPKRTSEGRPKDDSPRFDAENPDKIDPNARRQTGNVDPDSKNFLGRNAPQDAQVGTKRAPDDANVLRDPLDDGPENLADEAAPNAPESRGPGAGSDSGSNGPFEVDDDPDSNGGSNDGGDSANKSDLPIDPNDVPPEALGGGSGARSDSNPEPLKNGKKPDGRNGGASAPSNPDGADEKDEKKPDEAGGPGGESPNANKRGKGGGGSGLGEIGPGEQTLAPADAPRLQYSEAATNLALDYLENALKGKPDRRLLAELGWSESESRVFLERWRTMRREAAEAVGDDAEAKERYLQALENVGLGSELDADSAENPFDRARKLDADDANGANRPRESARQAVSSKIPAGLQDRTRAFSRGVSTGGRR